MKYYEIESDINHLRGMVNELYDFKSQLLRAIKEIARGRSVEDCAVEGQRLSQICHGSDAEYLRYMAVIKQAIESVNWNSIQEFITKDIPKGKNK